MHNIDADVGHNKSSRRRDVFASTRDECATREYQSRRAALREPRKSIRIRIRIMSRSFELQPTLIGDLLELRPLRAEHFNELFAAASDPLIWEQHPESDRYKREIFQRYFDGAIESKGAFAIVDRKSGRVIGSSRYCHLNLSESEVEIGWTFMERAYWGGDYNRELKQLMLDHAFKFVERVVFVVGETNLRSQKALEKIGAKLSHEKQLPDRDGRMLKNLVFAVCRPSASRQ
jgi:N-acetyltransferase